MKKPTEEYGLKFDTEKAVLEEDDFEKAQSIEDIEETLANKGVLRGTSGRVRRAKTYREARSSWRKLTRKEIGEKHVEELPSYSTKMNGEELHIHGYNHGFTWLPASEKVRELLTDTVEKHVGASNVIMEEGLKPHLKKESVTRRNNFQELNDVSWAFPREIPEADREDLPEDVREAVGIRSKARKFLPFAHKGQTGMTDRVLGAGKTLRIYSMAAMNKRFNHFSYDMAHSLNNSRKNPEYSLDHLNCARANMMPLKLEEEIISENAKFDVLTTQRSVYQAEQALQTEGDTHLIVGTGHIPQIEDYIDRVKKYGRKGNLPPK